MKLIVGLGNYGEKYARTYHNLGFIALDAVANSLGVSVQKYAHKALCADFSVGGEKVILAKPQTYMNLSGESVREIVEYYKIPIENILVIYDDHDLNKGAVRIRKEGSAGTHNGMKNIIENLGRSDFKRIRIGFKGEENIPLIDFVLSAIKKEDYEIFDSAVKTVSLAVNDFIKGVSFDEIMQKYNTKK